MKRLVTFACALAAAVPLSMSWVAARPDGPTAAILAGSEALPDMPSTLAGLAVTEEGVPPKAEGARPQLLREIRLYGLRGPDQRLEATLQLGRFRAGEDVNSRAFQEAVAARVGDTVPARQRIAGRVVYVSRAKQLSLAIWFRGSTMAVLSIRTEASTPKAIIRAALDDVR